MILPQIIGLTLGLLLSPFLLLGLALWLDGLLQDLLGKDDEGVRW